MMDSDSENEDFVSFGSPLEIIEEDEPLPKPISVEDQTARDGQGRQRFHGAFTGGFSAGFFNTVGSKEGFTPSTFVSSRGQRLDHHGQRPEDYMDEDDKGEYGIAPRKLVTSLRFAGEEERFKKRPAPNSSIIPDDGRLQEMIKPADDAIGARLLRKMGWKPGQGVGPKMERKKWKRRKEKIGGGGKVYGCSRPPILESQHTTKEDNGSSSEEVSDNEDDLIAGFLFAPDDIQDFMFALKDDQHGIGYRGMDSRSILGGHVTLFDEPIIKQNRRQGIKGHAFGIGAFEDEEENDVYSMDLMSNYDRVLGGEEHTKKEGMYGWTGPPQHSSGRDVLDGFKAASQKKISTKVFQPPELPRNFQPFHHFQSSTVDTDNQSKQEGYSRFTLSANQRAAMLGEEQLPGPRMIDEMLSSQDLALLKEARNKASSSLSTAPKHQSRWDRSTPTHQAQGGESARWDRSTPTHQALGGDSDFQPFAKEPEKQQRYENYLKNRQKGSGISLMDSRTEWEKQQETEEFSRAASLYHKPMSGMMASRFVRAKHTDDIDTVDVPSETTRDVEDEHKAANMKMFGLLTHDTMTWHPDKLLCKRFNVADPYPGSSVVGLPTVKKDKFSVFNFLEIQQPNQMDVSTAPGIKLTSKDEASEPSTSSLSVKKSRWDDHSGILANVGSQQKVKSYESQETIKVAEYDSKSLSDDDDIPRPPLDMFQAIFLDSDNSSSSDEDEDQIKLLSSKLQETSDKITDLDSSRECENPGKNDTVKTSEQNTHSYLGRTHLETFEDNPVESCTSDTMERDNVEENMDKEEEYGPLLPPNHSQVNLNSESQHDAAAHTKSWTDGKKKKRKKDKRSKKGRDEHQRTDGTRHRSKDRRVDLRKTAEHHAKKKKSKHKHSHHKPSKQIRKARSSSSNHSSDSSLHE